MSEASQCGASDLVADARLTNQLRSLRPRPNSGYHSGMRDFVLHTERLTLRPHALSDFTEYARMWAEPEVVRYTSKTPSTREESRSRLLRQAGHWTLHDFGYFVLREKESGVLVGEAGISDFYREMNPSLEGMPEMGWILASAAHGKGYATEAVKAVLQWSEPTLNHAKTVCIIDPANTASLKVAGRCGFKEVTRTTYKNEAVILFERLRA